MKTYLEQAEINCISLTDDGPCQFCGAETERGVHECQEIFNLGFEHLDYAKEENYVYRFMAVDAHTLQHPEVHGRWNNHFHLTRQHLMFTHNIPWGYEKSPLLSNILNTYKVKHPNEILTPPPIGQRGILNTVKIKEESSSEKHCKALIEQWGNDVYTAWYDHHGTVEKIAQLYLTHYY
jgi:hypothetical protein